MEKHIMRQLRQRGGIIGGALKVLGALCLLGWGMMLLNGTCAKMHDAVSAVSELADPVRAQSAATPSKRPVDFDASPTKRKQRERFVNRMIREGFWEKTEFTGLLPKVWVTEEFLYSSEKAQNETLEVAYAYWMGELDDFGTNGFVWDRLVVKIDNGTLLGKQIGYYTPIYGLSR